MSFLRNICAALLCIGLFSLVLGTANEVFDLGIWDGDYPILSGDGIETNGDYGKFIVQCAIVTGAVGLLGVLLTRRRVNPQVGGPE